MDQSENSLKAFFDRYAQASNVFDPATVASFYAESFIVAGPKGNAAFKNDEGFLQWLRQLGDFNQQVGMKEMTIINYMQSAISADYMMIRIKWGAQFHKTKDELFTFEISYFVYQTGNSPKIIMYISHEDQEDLMKANGLL
jgi:hypothetical protein